MNSRDTMLNFSELGMVSPELARAYAKAPFLKPAMSLGMTVVSRLGKDAVLLTVLGTRTPGRRGRPRVYTEGRIELAKRAGQRRGWTTGIFDLYGKQAKKRYKTFEEGRGVVTE